MRKLRRGIVVFVCYCGGLGWAGVWIKDQVSVRPRGHGGLV